MTSVVIVGPSSRAAAETAETADTEPAILREIVAVDMTTVIIRPEERLVLGFLNKIIHDLYLLKLVPQIDPSVPQPVVQSRRRPLLGPSPG